jgi:predicted HD superfamily hydrolase involved in NAD metabolism
MNSKFVKIFSKYFNTGDIFLDIKNFLENNRKNKTFEHSVNVAKKGMELASIYNGNQDKIKIAAYLHDISAVIPDDLKIEYSNIYNIDIIDVEKQVPMIIHQKISRNIAEETFSIKDKEILNAIECHTTLKSNPSKLDMILFISDKIKWDQQDIPPYINLIENGLKKSLDYSIKIYIKYLIDNKHQLKVIHPLLIEAYEYFWRKE